MMNPDYELSTWGVGRGILRRKKDLNNTQESNKIILIINTDKKTIARKTQNETLEYQFRKSDGKNKRFEYLIMITQSNSKVGANRLGNTTLQNISSELKNINEIIIKKLKLTKDLIVNYNNSGYEINKVYQIDLV